MPRLIGAALPARRAGRGFTLVEMLVAMILLAIIGGAMTKVLIKQNQYYRDSDRTSAARRELRLGATVLPSELRSISSSGGDIVSMSESDITVLAAIGASIVCAKGASWFAIPPTNLSRQTLTSLATAPLDGDAVFLYNDSTLKGSEDDKWEQFTLTGRSSTADCPGAPYTDAVLDPTGSKPRTRYTVAGTIQDSVHLGAGVRFARQTRYRIYQESSGNWYLGMQEYKGAAWNTIQPLAGPFRPFQSGDANPSGLQFRYFDTLGVRITDYTQTKSVGRIDVFLRTNAGQAAISERKGAALRDSVVMRVAIRNSK